MMLSHDLVNHSLINHGLVVWESLNLKSCEFKAHVGQKTPSLMTLVAPSNSTIQHESDHYEPAWLFPQEHIHSAFKYFSKLMGNYCYIMSPQPFSQCTRLLNTFVFHTTTLHSQKMTRFMTRLYWDDRKLSHREGGEPHYLREGPVIPNIALMGKDICHVSQLALLYILLNGIQWLLCGNLEHVAKWRGEIWEGRGKEDYCKMIQLIIPIAYNTTKCQALYIFPISQSEGNSTLNIFVYGDKILEWVKEFPWHARPSDIKCIFPFKGCFI